MIDEIVYKAEVINYLNLLLDGRFSKDKEAMIQGIRDNIKMIPSTLPDPCDVCKWNDDVDCTACMSCPAEGIE